MNTCGTCGHGQSVDFDTIRCRLGWEAHDNLLPSYDPKLKRKVPCVMGRGELEAPEATPTCRCGCQPESRWIPKST